MAFAPQWAGPWAQSADEAAADRVSLPFIPSIAETLARISQMTL